jgi:hypothetical protein
MATYESHEFSDSEVEIIADAVMDIADHFDYELDGKFEDLYQLLVDENIIKDKRVREREINMTIVVDVQGNFKCAADKDEDDIGAQIVSDVESGIESRLSGLEFDDSGDGIEWACEINYVETSDWNYN